LPAVRLKPYEKTPVIGDSDKEWTAFHAQGKICEKRSIVRLETTMGNIRIALNDETPVHRDNFLKLVSFSQIFPWA